jgi:hypothetical protein
MAELAAVECPIHENFKKAVIDAIEIYILKRQKYAQILMHQN